MNHYAGIDGGGTKSRLLVVDEARRRLYEGKGGCTNQYAVGLSMAVCNVKELLAQAKTFAPFSALCVASAGLGRETEKNRFREILGYQDPIYVCSDVEALLVGGAKCEEGICLISGTGSIAMARDKEGTVLRSGGFGWRLGDEGSAWWQGWQAMVRSMKSMEGRDLPTSMMDAILGEYGKKKPEELITLCNSDVLSKAEVAKLSPLVSRFAQTGDELAFSIITDSCKELKGLLFSLTTRMPLLQSREVVAAGGVLEHDRFFWDQLQKELGNSFILVPPKGSALDGAVLLAQETCRKMESMR
jgi:glucosamine kinase